MTFKDLDVVVLARDMPDRGLRRGDRGTVVDVLKDPEAYTVEFQDPDGKDPALLTLKASDLSPAPRTPLRAVLAGVAPIPDETLRIAFDRLARDGWEPEGALKALKYAYDETRGLYAPSSALTETPFEVRLPAYGRWRGIGGILRSGNEKMTVEALEPDPRRERPGLLLLGMSDAAAGRIATSADAATRWSGLLLDLFDSLGAVRCAAGPGLIDLDLSGRKSLPVPTELAILSKDDALARTLRASPPAGMRVIDLTAGSVLVTSLPVKPAP